MNILYLGDESPGTTSRQRAGSLIRCGQDVVVLDPYAALAPYLSGRVRSAIHHRTGYRLLQRQARLWIEQVVRVHAGWADLIWVNGGELFGACAVNTLRSFGKPVVLYNNDDPTGGRDGRRFDCLLMALPLYSLCIVLREPNVSEYLALGAKAVLRVWMSYDEVAHEPFVERSKVPECYQSEVAFIGTWIRGEGRDKFLLDLIDQGVNVSIWGDRWSRAPNWDRLRPHWRGSALSGRDYVASIQGAKITLGLLSHGNRDLHTSRSAEIPYAGGLLCAERTSEHQSMYVEGSEAVFWDDAKECANVCKRLLADDHLRERIRAAGMSRARSSEYGNDAKCKQILSRISTLGQLEPTLIL